MSDDGETKDDVKVPEGEIGEKIERLFHGEEKDTSQYPQWLCYSIHKANRLDYRRCRSHCYG